MKNLLCGMLALTVMVLHLGNESEARLSNHHQDSVYNNKIATYVWLYGKAQSGNKIAQRKLWVLERSYGRDLTLEAKRAAADKWGVDLFKRVTDLNAHFFTLNSKDIETSL